MIRTLADLNNAGKKLWGTKDESFQCPYCQHAPFPSLEALNRHIGPTHPSKPLQSHDDTGKRAQDDSLSEAKAAQKDKVKDFTTNPAEIEAAAKKAKAAGKSKEDFVAGYSGGAAETAARAWGKDEMSTRCANCNHSSGAHTKRGGNDRPCSLCDCKNFIAPNAQDSGIKTLADLNKAGRRFWRGPNLR